MKKVSNFRPDLDSNQSGRVTVRMLIIGFVVLFAGSVFFKLFFTMRVPQQTADYINNACEEAGGGLLAGDWPVYADGYLVDKLLRRVGNPILRSEPFLANGMRFVEYNMQAVYDKRYLQKPPEGSERTNVSIYFKGPYVRITVEEAGDPNCESFDLERRYQSTQLPDHLCLAMVQFEDPAKLWSRYKYQTYIDQDDTGPMPIRWAVWELVDLETNQVQASVRQFTLCASQPLTRIGGGGFRGCKGHSRESPQQFSCPPPGRGNDDLASAAVHTFLKKVVLSTDSLEDKE
jgi:hypothetical protein